MRPPYGFTLLELMLALAIGAVVLAGAGTMASQARQAYADLDRTSRMHEAARIALAHLAATLAHAGHLAPDSQTADNSPVVAIDGTQARRANRSDSLTLRWRGAPQVAIENCLGAPDPGTVARATYSVEPRAPFPLRCRYQFTGQSEGTADLVEGVRRLRLEYGVDTSDDGQADRWLAATAMSPALWQRVRLVRIQMDMVSQPQDTSFSTTVRLRNQLPG